MTADWIKGAMRQAMALLLLCALILAPIIIAATHGPGLPMDRAQATQHLLHGHSHDEPEPGQFSGGHDATDHEHPTQMVLPKSSDSVVAFSTGQTEVSEVAARSVSLSGLRRPPRDLAV